MGKIKLNTKEFRHILLLEEVSGVSAKDCIIRDEKIIYVVREGKAGLAIGKGGKNVKQIRNKIDKDVEIIEYNSSPLEFLKNLFKPANIRGRGMRENSNGEREIIISPESDKALVRSKLKKAQKLIQKYFNINRIVIK